MCTLPCFLLPQNAKLIFTVTTALDALPANLYPVHTTPETVLGTVQSPCERRKCSRNRFQLRTFKDVFSERFWAWIRSWITTFFSVRVNGESVLGPFQLRTVKDALSERFWARLRLVFQCLETWSNTRASVWYITSCGERLLLKNISSFSFFLLPLLFPSTYLKLYFKIN